MDDLDDLTIGMTTSGDINVNNSAEEMLSRMMSQTFQINIRGRKVDFDVRDQIFLLSAPVEPLPN